MGLFGLLKQEGEELFSRLSGWLEQDHVVASLATAGLTFIEEFTNAFVRSALSLTGRSDTIYKQIHRILFSGIYYFALKDKDPLIALMSGTVPVVLVINDLIQMLAGISPEEAGQRVAERFAVVRSEAVNFRNMTPNPSPAQVVSEAVSVPSSQPEQAAAAIEP